MSQPLISVIVPVYNVEKYLDKCVRSIMNQTYRNLEIILVDDGSPDNCPAMCDAYAKEDPRIKVIHKENGGQADARNQGIDIASGEYIGFIDSDDFVDEDMYEYLIEIAQKEQADVVTCECYDYYAEKEILRHDCDFYEKTNRIDAIARVMESRKATLYVVDKLYRKEIFDNLRFRKGKTFEDAYIVVEILSKTKTVVFTNAQKYYYYHRLESTTSKPFNAKSFDVVEAYDYNADLCLKISPFLSEPALFRRCWSRFYVLDKMMLSDESYDHKAEKEYVAFLKANKSFILKSNLFTKGRKLSFAAMLISIKLYRKVVRYYTYRNITYHD